MADSGTSDTVMLDASHNFDDTKKGLEQVVIEIGSSSARVMKRKDSNEDPLSPTCITMKVIEEIHNVSADEELDPRLSARRSSLRIRNRTLKKKVTKDILLWDRRHFLIYHDTKHMPA